MCSNNRISLEPLLLALTLLTFTAQGDEPAPPVSMFALPKIPIQTAEQLQPARESSATVEINALSLGSAPALDQGHDEMSVSSVAGGDLGSLSPVSIGTWESMNGLPVLSQIEQPEELGGAIGWVSENVWDPVFAPEVVKLGKVKITGGVVAAIKRKNPFCLLNPLVFAASW